MSEINEKASNFMDARVQTEMRGLVAVSVHSFLVEILPQIFSAPYSGQALDATLGGIADAIRELETEAGSPLQAALVSILLEQKE